MGYAEHATAVTMRQRLGKLATTLVAAAAGAAMALTMMPLTTSTASAADNEFTDSGKVTTYAPTGVGGGTTTSPDAASDKFAVTANDTAVEAVQYTANGHNFDIARFQSTSRTPVIKVKVSGVDINTVNIYPQRYYPATAYTVDKATNTLTFKMEKSLYEAIVMINGDATNKAGQPYLAVINDPPESEREGTVPDKTSAADGSGINEATGVLNIQEFGKKWFETHSNAEIQAANLPKATKSAWAGKTVGKTEIPQDAQVDAGKIVPANTSNVTYPNERALAADDYTYVLQAALEEIKSNDKLNTLYFPNGTYIYGGLDIAKWTTKPLKVYVDEGALLKNHVQPNREAMEPAIGIWSSKDITISGRGVFDNNGVANYDQRNGGDNHDAYRSQHQGGVMVVKSQNITFNDTYMRDAKQWNYETHTAENVTFNNIKGLTPYPQPWVDGTDLASGKNLTINGVMTLGNDDAFASGHYNPGNQFQPTHADNIKGFGMNGDNPRTQEWIDAAAAYEYYSQKHDLDNLAWDTDDTENVTVNNTVNWSAAGGNGIRLGHNVMGHTLKNYTFNNFNPIAFQGGGRGITVQNNTGTYPKYEDFTIKNSSFDTSRVGTNFSINGKDPLIKNVTVDNVWFSNASAVSNITNIETAKLNDIYIGGKQVQYTNQNKLTVSNVKNLTYTYTDADGKTQPVKTNSLPTFTAPESDVLTAKSNNVLDFKVAATDADEGDSVVVALDETTLPEGAKYDAKTGEFTWKPTEAQAGKTYAVKFTAADEGAQAGDYNPVAKTVTITVLSSSSATAPVAGTVTGDTWVGSWSGDQGVNYGTGRTLRVSGANGDTKRGYVNVDLSKITLGDNDTASLSLTYIGHRSGANATDKAQLKVTKATAAVDPATVTWKTQPALSTDAADSATSAEFTLGSTVVPEGTEDNVKGTGIDGRKITVDITALVKAAKTAGETTLPLAIDNTGTGEIRFVSTEGATTDKLNNAKDDMVPVVEVTTVSPAAISGPTAQTIDEGETGSSEPFELTGADPLKVALSGDTADGKITWNNDTNRLDFAAGIAAGDHKVTVTLTDAKGGTASADFTLTVKAVAKPDTTAPVFKGVEDVTLDYGADFDPLAGVTATDDVDGDVTANIKVSGSVDTSKAGEYTLTYTVADKAGNVATATRKVTVKAKPDTTAPVFKGVEDVTVEYGADFDPLAGVTATDDVDGDVTADIKVEGTVDTKTAGDYTLTYTVADKAGNTAKATRKVNVKAAPLTGIEVAEPSKLDYTVGQTYDATGLKVSKVFADGSTSDAAATEYTVTAVDADGKSVDLSKPFAEAGEVTVTVKLNDTDFSKSFKLTVSPAPDTTAPVFAGVEDVTVNYGADFDPLAGVTATDAVDGDVTKDIKVEGKVDTKKAGEYTLTYTVADAAKNVAAATRKVTVKTQAESPASKDVLDKLNEAIADAEKLNKADYKSGWDAFEAALESAKKLAGAENVTNGQVVDAINALKATEARLVKVTPTEPTKPGDNNGQNNGKPAPTAPKGDKGNAGNAGLSKTGASVTAVAVATVLLLAVGAGVTVLRRRG
ncbi:immunoglobulin-like domain-containing protein [Bifidobacterium leontopitheci]|uniref:Bacterial Ig-like domain (Group 3) n=1 Tax=Bifidobacterium leontopitheci TaxID=2650774 RepID=A0A6I1GI55_9BIFI|nr:immunoglobulin-like domain-containing protein [Bifidobacterium leontopitheci]KAB7790352.1 Bacterial Ig-like domain (group 3) [Bifidobacterium leontopitheci]